MADEASGEEQPITFHIKTSGDAKYTVTVPLSMTVQSLKETLSSDSYASVAPERQRLIYSGRVLKDGDTLASYKIKENNTVHMVKSAESNVRNQPANAGVPSASTGAATPAAPTMATGTGANNLLAGLTGARFAGLAQLPNQSMFGPDGGMGPPPDPEEHLRQLENPAFRQQMSEMLNNPAVLDEMIRQNPMLANVPNARQMLQSPMFRQMMTDPQMIRQQMQMMRAMGQGPGGQQSSFAAPGGVEEGQGAGQESGTQGAGTQNQPPNPFAMFGQGGGMGGDNPFAALMNPAMFGGQGGGAAGQGQGGDAARGTGSPAAQNPFASPFGGAGNPMMDNMMQRLMQNPELMQQLTQAMFAPAPGQEGAGGAQSGGQGAGAGAGAGMMNPFAALGGFGGAFGAPPAGPPDNRPPEERYADELRQLNDMGFYEFERNIEALRRSGGSVQGAVNYLLGG